MEPTTQHLAYHVGNSYLNCLTQGDPAQVCSISFAYVCVLIGAAELPPPQCDRFENDPGVARNATGSDTYINPNKLDTKTSIIKAHIFAHELGHTLRLRHHDSSGACLMSEGQPPITAPRDDLECEIGFADPFSTPELPPCAWPIENWGIRCIYQWWREQAPALDCYDVNRDGQVSLTGDILAAINAWQGTAGEPTYLPDADVNRDGHISLTPDIVGISNQWLHLCEVDHYPHS